MRSSPSLVWGGAMLGSLVAGCLLGPLLLPDTGDGDPVHAPLLPPFSTVTVVELIDGTDSNGHSPFATRHLALGTPIH